MTTAAMIAAAIVILACDPLRGGIWTAGFWLGILLLVSASLWMLTGGEGSAT